MCLHHDQRNGRLHLPGRPQRHLHHQGRSDHAALRPPIYQTGDPDGLPSARDNQTTVTVGAADVTNKNFGYEQLLGSISGTVCDGTVTASATASGETTLPDVPVFLTYAGPDGVIGTADDVVYHHDDGWQRQLQLPEPAARPLPDHQGHAALAKTSLADADGGNPNNISVVLDFGLTAS